MQIALKHARKFDGADQELLNATNLTSKKEAERESREAFDRKKRDLETAAQQLEQIKQKADVKSKDREALKEEAKRIFHDDDEYIQSQSRLDNKKKNDSITLVHELDEMLSKVREHRAKETEKEKETEIKIQQWVTTKESQTKKKQEMERLFFLRGQKITQRIGEDQQKALKDADTHLEEQIRLRIVKRDERYKKEDEAKLAKLNKNKQELKYFFDKHVRNYDIDSRMRSEKNPKEKRG
jgi:hypothetical protein